jgi:hypothetical protein
MLHRFTWLSFHRNTFKSAVTTDQLQVDQVMYSSHVALLLMQFLCCLVCYLHMLAVAHLTDLEEDLKETAVCRWSLPAL